MSKKKKKALLDMLISSAYPTSALNTSKNKNVSIKEQLEIMQNEEQLRESPKLSGDNSMIDDRSPALRPIDDLGEGYHIPRP